MSDDEFKHLESCFNSVAPLILLYDIKERSRWGKITEFEFSLTTSTLGASETLENFPDLLRNNCIESDLQVIEKDVAPQYIADVGAEFERIVSIKLPKNFRESCTNYLTRKVSQSRALNSKKSLFKSSNKLLKTIGDSLGNQFSIRNLPKEVTNGINWYLLIFYLEEKQRIKISKVSITSRVLDQGLLNELEFTLEQTSAKILASENKEPLIYKGFHVLYSGRLSSHIDSMNTTEVTFDNHRIEISETKRNIFAKLIIANGSTIIYDDLFELMKLPKKMEVKEKKRRLTDAMCKLNALLGDTDGKNINYIKCKRGSGYFLT